MKKYQFMKFDGGKATRAVKLMVLVPTALVAGCVSTTYRESVAEFGEVTKAAVDLQSTNLKAIVDAENAVILRKFAVQRTDLQISGDCLPAVLNGATIQEVKAACPIEDGSGTKLRSAPDFAHILKLGDALGSYSASVAQLAKDSSEDRATFKKSLADAASEASKLEGALRKALEVEGKPPATDKLGVLAGIVGDVGGLLLEKQRVDALKSIIIEADPIVQESVVALQAAYIAERSYNTADRTRQLRASQSGLKGINANLGSTLEQRMAAQAHFIEIAENYVLLARAQDRFLRIGAAHSALKQAAQKDATKEDLKAGIRAVFEVARSVGEATPKLKNEEKK